MKKALIFILLLTLSTANSFAVLKEKDLAGTLIILRNELTAAYEDNALRNENYSRNNQVAQENMYDILKSSDQNALMLYSQKKEYVFDLAYACHEASEQYKNFQAQAQPFKRFADKTSFDRARYDSLITTLRNMPDAVLDSTSRENKAVCLALAVNLQRQLKERDNRMQEQLKSYTTLGQRLSQLNDYANVRYAEIQRNIFRNGGTDYFTLLSDLASQMMEVEEAVSDKYKSYKHIRSEWDVRVMGFLFGAILFYGIIAILLNIAVLRYLLPRRFRTEGFLARRGSIIMATTIITFAIAISVVMGAYKQNFLSMAGELLVQYSWLLGVIILSVLARVSPNQLKNAYRIYSPLVIVSFTVIFFRIVLIPNALVNLIFPPVILLCALLQWFVIRRYREGVPSGDLRFVQISQVVFIFSLLCSFAGFTLLAVQALIWWTMQLTCILTISCMRGWLKSYEETRHIQDEPVNKVWMFYFVQDVAVPVLAICSVMISVYWAADVFNLSDTVMRFFDYNIINEENLRISMLALVCIVSLWFLFSYISKLIISLVRHNFAVTDPSSADSRTVMIKNVVQVIVWGTWFMISLVIMRVNTTWLAVIGGGLSTGIGFASKDIIENIYYGISLMAGRIKIGDFIECDGTRGKVTSISYTSTLLEAVDGSIIAFQNSQLFTKNYKNLTRNHGYVVSKINFGVAYGSKPKEVTSLITQAVKAARIPGVDRKKTPTIILSDLADSSVNFILIVWVDVTKQAIVESNLRTLIYNTLNEHGIEIPFPQQDVHIKDIAPSVQTAAM